MSYAIFTLLSVFVGCIVAGTIEEKTRWHDYASEHCQIIDNTDVNGVSRGPSLTEYKCDDGLDYWKAD